MSCVPLGGQRDAASVVSRANRGCWGHATSQEGATALVLAASRGRKDMVELLVDRGADLEAKDEVSAGAMGYCATLRAGRHGRSCGAVMGMSCRGVVLLWRAVGLVKGAPARRGDVGGGVMVRRGAVPRGPATSQYGCTALVLAASGGHTETVELLLDITRGADLEAKDRVSVAAVCVAAPRAAPGVTGGRVGR